MTHLECAYISGVLLLTSLAKRLATTPPPPTRDTQQLNMSQLSYDEKHCVRFLNKFKDWPDPTWGFGFTAPTHARKGRATRMEQTAIPTHRKRQVRHYHASWEKYRNLLTAVMFRYCAFRSCTSTTARSCGRHAMVPPSGAVQPAAHRYTESAARCVPPWCLAR
jgi:hypothetical protein